MKKFTSLVLTLTIILSLFAPMGTMAQTTELSVQYSLRDNLTTVRNKNSGVLTATTFEGESCTKFQGNNSGADLMYIGYDMLGEGDLTVSIDVYITDTVKQYRFATGSNGRLSDDIDANTNNFIKNAWNNLTLVVTRETNKNTLYVNGTKISDRTAAISGNTIRLLTLAPSKEAQPDTVTYLDDFFIYSGKVTMPVMTTNLSTSGNIIKVPDTSTNADVLSAITTGDANYSKEILYNSSAVTGTDTVKDGSKLVIKQGDVFIADYTIQTLKTITPVQVYRDDLSGLSPRYSNMSTAYFGGENCTQWVGKESINATTGNPETQMWGGGTFTGAGNEDLVLSVSFYPTDTVEAVNFATTGHADIHEKITANHWVPDAWNTMTVVVDTDTNQNRLYLNNEYISTTTRDVSDVLRFVTWAKGGNLPGATIYVDDFYIVKGSFEMPLITTTSLNISGKNIDASGKTYAQVKEEITLNNDEHTMAITYKGSDVTDSDTVKNGAKLTISQYGVFVGEFTLTNATLTPLHVIRDSFTTFNPSHCNVTDATLNGEPCFLLTGKETDDPGNQMFVAPKTDTTNHMNQDLVISVSVYATTQINNIKFATGGHTEIVPVVPLAAMKLNKWNEIAVTIDYASGISTVYVNGEYYASKIQSIKDGIIRICVYGSSETGKILGTTAYLDNLVISQGTAKFPAATTTLPLEGMYINGYGGMTYSQIANTFKGTNPNTTFKFFKGKTEIANTSAAAEKDAHMAVYTNGVFVSEYVLGTNNYTMGEFVKSAEKFGMGSYTAGYEVANYSNTLNAMAVLAQYDRDSMVKCNVSYKPISGKVVADVTLEDISELDGTYLKYFLLEEETLKPICDPVTIYPYCDYAIESMIKMYPGFTMKAATFSYDDGVNEDIQTIESLNKYGAKATFNVVAKWRDGTSDRLLQYYNDKGATDEERFAYIKELYKGHEIASHSYSHPPVHLEEGQTSQDSASAVLEGVSGDTVVTEFAENHKYINDNMGIEMSGIAWPYSGPYNRSDYTTIRNAILDSGYVYARNHTDSYSFDLPTDWFKWSTTSSISKMPQVTDQFVKLDAGEEMKLLYIWGHSYEYARPEQYGSGDWETLEENLAKLQDEGVWFATNREVYDYINAVNKVTSNTNTVTNNSDMTVYVQVNGQNVELDAGETFVLNEDQNNLPSIACWGDSLTLGQGASDRVLLSYPGNLANLTGATVYNMGVGGETPITIASRQGVLNIVFTEDFTIPQSSTEEVEIKFKASNEGVVTPRNASIGGWAPCTINGVEGTMRIVLNDKVWPKVLVSAHFKRNVSGKAVEVKVGDKLIPYAQSVRGDINIIYSGANDGWTVANEKVPSDDYSADIPPFLNLLESQGMDSNNKQYIIIGLTTYNDAKWALLDSEMEEKFGDKFLNLRKFISSTEAFELAGVTPTDDDLAAIAAGAIPPSFLTEGDPTHYNDIGYELAAIAINNKLQQLGYID